MEDGGRGRRESPRTPVMMVAAPPPVEPASSTGPTAMQVELERLSSLDPTLASRVEERLSVLEATTADMRRSIRDHNEALRAVHRAMLFAMRNTVDGDMKLASRQMLVGSWSKPPENMTAQTLAEFERHRDYNLRYHFEKAGLTERAADRVELSHVVRGKLSFITLATFASSWDRERTMRYCDAKPIWEVPMPDASAGTAQCNSQLTFRRQIASWHRMRGALIKTAWSVLTQHVASPMKAWWRGDYIYSLHDNSILIGCAFDLNTMTCEVFVNDELDTVKVKKEVETRHRQWLKGEIGADSDEEGNRRNRKGGKDKGKGKGKRKDKHAQESPAGLVAPSRPQHHLDEQVFHRFFPFELSWRLVPTDDFGQTLEKRQAELATQDMDLDDMS